MRKLNYTLGKKAIKRMRKGKLGVYPLIDCQGIPAIYFLHKDVQRIQWFADKVLNCSRRYIRKKGKYYYIKAVKHFLTRWKEYVEANPLWKRSW